MSTTAQKAKRGKKEATRLSVLLDPPTSELFDSFCKERALKKSTYVAKLIKDQMRVEGFSLQTEIPISQSKRLK